MHRRSLLRVGLLALATPLTGCGHDAPPPDDMSNLPPEVKADEEAREAQVKKGIAEREKQKKP